MRAANKWSLIAASALLAAPVGATTVCGGSTFSTCASVTVTKVLLSNGNVRVRIAVLNESGLGGRRASFTRIGLWGVPETARYVPGSLIVGGGAHPNDWRFANSAPDDEDEDGAKKLAQREKEDPVLARMKGVRLKRGVLDGLPSGQPAFFEFDLSGVSIDDVHARDWLLHAEDAGNACSTTMIGQNGTLNEPRSEPVSCSAAAVYGSEAVVTPEPPAFVLLASALAGLTALAWRRNPRI